ncbi:MAG: matrixin family metalloprotease, partial [Planctomycetota bacterium]
MHPDRRLRAIFASAAICCCLLTASARGFLPDDRWSRTVAGTTGIAGDPIELSWSLVPDGTSVLGTGGVALGPSDLIATLDSLFGDGPGGDDYTRRPWFDFFESSFERYSELGGLSYRYEPDDDGRVLGGTPGAFLRRGDVRIGGVSIDGDGNVLGFNGLPDGGDMVLDTDDEAFLGNAAGDHVRIRNVIMHEHGHGLGLLHVNSNDSALLMESFIQSSFEGPQLDEIRGIHFFYGDVYEKSNGLLGNDTASQATDLGSLTSGHSLRIGADADVRGQAISADAVDFVSIDRATDVDVYSFDVQEPTLLDAVLTPRGGVFNQAAQDQTPTRFDANARVDLALDILDADGRTVLAAVDETRLGGVEAIISLALPAAGQYFARVTGLEDSVQLYDLRLSAAAPAIDYLPADFTEDGVVDALDLALWEQSFGVNAVADADDDFDSDGFDFLVWQRQWGASPLGAS